MTSRQRSRKSPAAGSRRSQSRTAEPSGWSSSLNSKAFGGSSEVMKRLRSVKREVSSAISRSHRLDVADLVTVPQGSIPITTSGKIRRSACVDRYRQDEFARLDVPL